MHTGRVSGVLVVLFVALLTSGCSLSLQTMRRTVEKSELWVVQHPARAKGECTGQADCQSQPSSEAPAFEASSQSVPGSRTGESDRLSVDETQCEAVDTMPSAPAWPGLASLTPVENAQGWKLSVTSQLEVQERFVTQCVRMAVKDEYTCRCHTQFLQSGEDPMGGAQDRGAQGR